MPYNTRRKSLSLPSLGIHVPMTHAARAAAAAAAAHAAVSSKKDSRPASSAASMSPPVSGSEHVDSHSSKRQKRSHAADSAVLDQTPPPSPGPESSTDMPDAEEAQKIDFDQINDDIVEAVIVQLQTTGNRPHLVKELATVLAQRLTSVQHSANPCAIISSRLAAYLKRSCWSALAPCPLAKELEAVHPRRTYFFLTTCPRQPLPEPNSSASFPGRQSDITPSVSLTDDSTSDEADEARRRELSPSPEVDLSPEFEDGEDDFSMPITPIGSLPSHRPLRAAHRRDHRHNPPQLERDEREFTQTADVLQKRKFQEEAPVIDAADRYNTMEYYHRDDVWFNDSLLTSPAMQPSVTIPSAVQAARKEDEADSWAKLNKLLEWDKTAESIEIDELDGLFESY